VSGFSGGLVLVLVGALVISQVTAGKALQRLGVI
jgi:hypothetical protein